MRKKHIALSAIGVFGLSLLLILAILFNPYRIDSTLQFTSEHIYIGAGLLFLLRITGVILPFIPAGIISFALIPIFGWKLAFFCTASGIFTGTSIAFFLARTYREPLVERFASIKRIHKLEKQITGKKQFLALVAFRIFTVPVVDISSYAAGLTKVSFKKFALASLVATLPQMLTFYFGEEAYRRIFGKDFFIGILAVLIIGSIYFIIKRYKVKLKAQS
jgi:uncharacterized membrane protein YdjX (TVP38/TMEM64 family)